MKKGVKYRHFLKYMLLKRLLLKGLCLFYDSLSQLHVAELQINFFLHTWCSFKASGLTSIFVVTPLLIWATFFSREFTFLLAWYNFCFYFFKFFFFCFWTNNIQKKNQRETETKKPCKYLFFSSCFKNTPNKELRMYQASYKASIELKA